MIFRIINMKYCSSKDINSYIKKLLNQGWSFKCGGKHGRLLPPNRKIAITVSRSPSDRYAFLNFKRDVKHLTGHKDFIY